jgi:hypothetical protein
MNATRWQAQDPAVCAGGDVGGDYQAGEAWSVRLASSQVPGALITVYAFAEACRRHDPDMGDVPADGEYTVQVMIEYLTCTDVTDPGGTETWSDMVYDSAADTQVYSDGDEADAAARKLAEAYAANPGRFGWRGKPFYRYEDRPGTVRVCPASDEDAPELPDTLREQRGADA